MERMIDMDRSLRRPRSDLSLSLAALSPPAQNQTSASSALHHHLSSLRTLRPEDRGVRLIQMLLTCANHAADYDIPRADACLSLISTLSSPSGDSMQRLATLLAASLAARLLRHRWFGILSSLHQIPAAPAPNSSDQSSHECADLAFARGLPYLPFAHAVIGRTLVRALAHERVVHLVDLGANHSSIDLWAPVLRSLSRTPRGLRLTCISPDSTVLESLGSALAREAEALNIPFQFNPVESALCDLSPESLRVRPGEALAVASVLSLHQLLADGGDEEEEGGPTGNNRWGTVPRIEWFLAALRAMSPKVVAIAEQESDHNSTNVVERFSEVLHYYGAIFDSVESAAGGGTMTEDERAGVESALGREVENVIVCEGEERVERHEKAERWVARMGRAGFRQWRAWNDAGEEGRKVVESWPGNGRYSVAIYYSCQMICWHDRPLYAISAWHCL